jgi:hypothetical protein
MSACATNENDCAAPEIRSDYDAFRTELVDLGWATEDSCWFTNLDTFKFPSPAQAFGRDPNALPQFKLLI